MALDGTSLCCPDTAANLAVYRKGGGYHGGTGYPMVRLAALVACGTRALLAAVFGPTSVDEKSYATGLLAALHPGMLVLADRHFGYRPMLAALAGTGADLLVRSKAGHRLPVCRRCRDGSWISRIGPLEVRVICATITVDTPAGRRSERYQLITTVADTEAPAVDLVRLYHQRWEIETAYLELKSSMLGGRVLRARTPAGIEQEIYALLVTYQALRIAICDATLGARDTDPDRGSFTIALHAARDQVIEAAGVIADTSDLLGVIGQQVLDHLLPRRRCRTSPRVVKRAIPKFAAHAVSGRFHGPGYTATISIDITTDPDP